MSYHHSSGHEKRKIRKRKFTYLLYVSNIPSSMKPVLLLHELENKWSRMLYLENSFSGMRDALIYNPSSSMQQFYNGVQKLRSKVFDDNKCLSVSYVWFPPPNVFITTMIPDGASILSYIFVENLHKEGNVAELTAELPLQQHDIKLWDIPERQDKCLIIKLPPSSNTAMRSYVLGTLRNRKIKGFFPQVYEMIISDTPELSKVMVPKTIQTTESSESLMANFLFLHNIPSKLNVKSLVDSTKIDNIKGCRVFFLETINKLKMGFIYIPKTLPYNKFIGLFEKLRTNEYTQDDGTSSRIDLDEVWFQPADADPPILTDEEQRSLVPPEFVLMNYLYLHNIPPNFVASQLLMGSPFAVKLYVFTVNDLSTQIGFVVLRGLSPENCQMLIEHFRNLVIGGLPILVDEIYLKCYNLADIETRDAEYIPRLQSTRVYNKRCIENSTNGTVESTKRRISKIKLSKSPPEGWPLMKSEFICLSNLPNSMNRSAILFNIGVAVGGCVLTTCSDGKPYAFVYLPDCDPTLWENVISKLASKNIQGNFMDIHEIYLQSNDDCMAIIGNEYRPSPFIFIYNFPSTPVEDERSLLYHELIFDIAFMDTDNGGRCGIATLYSGTEEGQIVDCLNHIRTIKIQGKPLFGEIMWFADVKVDVDQPPEKKVRCLME